MLLTLLSLITTAAFAQMGMDSPYSGGYMPSDNCGNVQPQDFARAAFEMRQTALLGAIPCIQLKSGESKTIAIAADRSPSGVEHAYRLTKTGPFSYLSEVSLNLEPADASITPKDIQAFKTKIDDCLKLGLTDSKGPDGETLTVRRTDELDRMPTATIQVAKTVPRENSRLYSLDSTCPTIVHEVLHLHGLVDEYPESSLRATYDDKTGMINIEEKTKGALAYTCRHLGYKNSVMRTPFEAMKERLEWVKWSYRTCTNSTCSQSESKTVMLRPGESPANFKDERVVAGSEKKEKVIKPVKDHMLEPAQFRAVVHPGCEQNKLYYACASNAYNSQAMPVFGTGRPQGLASFGRFACNPTPKECDSPETWTSN